MKAMKVIYTTIKLATVAIAILLVMSLVSCKEEPPVPTLSPNGVETIEVENIETETIEVETIEPEYISDEYLAEIEFNSRTNKW